METEVTGKEGREGESFLGFFFLPSPPPLVSVSRLVRSLAKRRIGSLNKMTRLFIGAFVRVKVGPRFFLSLSLFPLLFARGLIGQNRGRPPPFLSSFLPSASPSPPRETFHLPGKVAQVKRHLRDVTLLSTGRVLQSWNKDPPIGHLSAGNAALPDRQLADPLPSSEPAY